MKPGSLAAILLLLAVAVGHLLRLAFSTEVIISDAVIPQWVSIIAVLIASMIAWLLWKESRSVD